MALEPSLWKILPKELLDLVFAHLPIARIGQLRALSKEWKKNIDCKDSEFNRVMDATAYLNMFALLPWRNYSGSGHIYDVRANNWHIYETNAKLENDIYSATADGGLVFLHTKWKRNDNNSGFFYVMNPLTKQKTQLPPVLNMESEESDNDEIMQVRMLKFSVDMKTKEYKVFVVGSTTNGGGGFFAQVYDSYKKDWTVVEATEGHIIGLVSLQSSQDKRLCVYNFANGTLQHFNRTNIAPGLKVKKNCYVLIEDHLFVLHKEASPNPPSLLEFGASVLPKYCISEFHFPTTAWVKLRVHSCGPYNRSIRDTPIGITMQLLGCNGFLLVCDNVVCGDNSSKRAWLYNLSTCEWHCLPAFEKLLFSNMMCMVNWSAMA